MTNEQNSSSGFTTIVAENRGDADGSDWDPILGDELQDLLSRKLPNENAQADVRRSSLQILRQCLGPNETEGSRTGLIVGRVQSGKTLSFTGVTAAACDNGYRMVVVLAGTKRILAQQTRDRIKRDLRVEEGPSRPWCVYHNPSATSDFSSISDILDLWSSQTPLPGTRQTVVITVHKNPTQLARLRALLEHFDVESLGSVLVVDDEADQAGLNTQVKQGTQSPTYRAILDLRRSLPAHTYLQYTATPQGNLLISFLDLLSPDFAAVLQPGASYVGGPQMFDGSGRYMEAIPAEDIPDPDDPPDSPPASFHRAMRLFFLGLADWGAKAFPDVDGAGNRSMMVHPSRLRDSHQLFAHWARSRIRLWQQILSDENNPDRAEVIEEFRGAYEDLATTVDDIRPFDELTHLLSAVMHMTEIRIVNSDRSTEIPWHQRHAWLLVGGANLDRGFTVEGLTVTYMPRGPGVGNADTIQQRGRFFGYKAGYLGYCRVFLEQEVGRAFREYTRHEQSIHEWLADSIEQGVPLQDLPRRFLIDPNLRPTRAAILTDDVRRARFREEWFRQYTPLESPEDCRSNRSLVESFLANHELELREDEPHSHPDRRSDHQRHHIVTGIDLSLMYEQLLASLRIPGAEDTDRWLTAMYLIEHWVREESGATAAVVRMRGGQRAKRAISEDSGKLENPFQGPSPDRRGEVYPGDRAIRAESATLQVHSLDLYKGSVDRGECVAEDVPVLALWLADPLRQHLVTLNG